VVRGVVPAEVAFEELLKGKGHRHG